MPLPHIQNPKKSLQPLLSLSPLPPQHPFIPSNLTAKALGTDHSTPLAVHIHCSVSALAPNGPKTSPQSPNHPRRPLVVALQPALPSVVTSLTLFGHLLAGSFLPYGRRSCTEHKTLRKCLFDFGPSLLSPVCHLFRHQGRAVTIVHINAPDRWLIHTIKADPPLPSCSHFHRPSFH